jgi:DNA-binding beta-propeller fold protein YncE
MRATRGTIAAGIALAGGVLLAAGCGDNAGSCASGTVCTWAGTGEPARGMDGVDRRANPLYQPMDVEFAPDGRGYIVDWQNHVVWRTDAAGKMTIVIGTDEIGDGPPVEADERTPPGVAGTTINLNHPTDVTFTADGTLLLAAWHNHKVRQMDTDTGLVDVTCGNGPGFSGDGGPAADALMNRPKAVAVDPTSGNIFVVDANNTRVRRIQAAAPNNIDTVAGSATRGFAGDGGSPLDAAFTFQELGDNPEPGGGIAIDAQGLLYVVDTMNSRVRRVDLANDVIETIAGNGTAGFSGDGGPATDASLNLPRDAEIGPDGRLYIADTENQRVRAVDLTTGIITTVAGNGQMAYGGDGGPPLQASFWRPWGVAFDGAGNLYVADTYNNRIREIVK